VLPWVEVATSSVGQGLPTGVGVARAGKRLDAGIDATGIAEAARRLVGG
jgi:transketolase